LNWIIVLFDARRAIFLSSKPTQGDYVCFHRQSSLKCWSSKRQCFSLVIGIITRSNHRFHLATLALRLPKLLHYHKVNALLIFSTPTHNLCMHQKLKQNQIKRENFSYFTRFQRFPLSRCRKCFPVFRLTWNFCSKAIGKKKF
jgi:hypothetical protein